MRRAIVTTGAFVAVCLLLATGCSQKPVKQVGMVPHDASPLTPGTSVVKSGTIGTVKWEVYDTRSGKVISNGDRNFVAADVRIEAVADFFSKKIDLGDHFSMGVSGDPGGFALTGERDDEQTFSWDWFTDSGSGLATKLQEPGELAFETVTTANGLEISRLEFLTDVSIRVTRMGDPNPLEPAWRIKVFKGSVIVWPALINGVITEQ